MDWLRALQHLREHRVPAVVVTISEVRGHAPRAAGAKLVVAPDATWGSIGGGNLEEVAVRRARVLLDDGATAVLTERHDLSDRAPVAHGVQCCGGEVTLLYEPLPVRRSIAVFGLGHVGYELALLLSRHDLELHLVDSRAGQLAEERLAPLRAGPADVRLHRVPVLPELVVADLPPGTDVLVLTHDHAEDLALLDALLRADVPGALGSIGLIGSSAKWARFRTKLAGLGHDAEAIERVRTPIGASGPPGKEPATIALAVAVELLAPARNPVAPSPVQG